MPSTCPVGVVEQFSSYALCSPNLWMIIACTFMTLLTLTLMCYLRHGLRRDAEWLRFANWKFQQLAERLRIQEPNVTLLERITRRVNEKNTPEQAFEDFFQKSIEIPVHAKDEANKSSKLPHQNASNELGDDVAKKVKQDKEDDVAKVLRDTNIDNKTPVVARSGGRDSILRKWKDATKDILAIDDNDGDQKNNNYPKADAAPEGH
uniref:Uncharacterized protein n=1 Tax=Caenorhabditis japonica TaxID=281687 RepID=A0A8R1DIN5_CAEJA